MTSRKKIQVLTKAAKKLSCTVVIQGRPPGVMIVEAANESDSEAQKAVESWIDVVRRLRYKHYQLMRMEPVQKGDLGLEVGHVREFGDMKELGKYLDERGVWQWWVKHMGFARS